MTFLKNPLFTIAFCLCFSFSFGQDTVTAIAYTQSAYWYFGFDDQDSLKYFHIDTTLPGNVFQFGPPKKQTFNQALSEPNVLVTDTVNPYPSNNLSAVEFVIFSDDYTEIFFHHYFITENQKDGGWIEYSTDGGQNWDNVINHWNFFPLSQGWYTTTDSISSAGTVGFTNSNQGMTKVGFTIGAGLNNVRLRFIFSSDSSQVFDDGWMIDNLTIFSIGTNREEDVSSYVQVFPNPVSDLVRVRLENDLRLEKMTLFDLTGKKIESSFHTEMNIQHLPGGHYFLKVETDKGVATKKILIE